MSASSESPGPRESPGSRNSPGHQESPGSRDPGAGGWTAQPLPPETAAAVRAGIADVVDGIVAAVGRENPVYADVLGGPEGMGIKLGIEQAVRAFLDAVERGQRPGAETAELWRRLGEAEFQAGRSLEALRAAFRTGTRAAWREAAELATQAGLDARIVIALAEAIFVYSDELGTDVAEGYLRIQSDEAGERERRRRRVATLLTEPTEHDPEAIAHAAELARWPLPRTVAALALSSPSESDSEGETARQIMRGLDDDVLAGADSAGAYLIVPDPGGPGRAEGLERAGEVAPAALGPTVPISEARRSLSWARLALRLANEGSLTGHPGLIRVTDHLATVIVLQDRELAAALAERRLAPLQALPAAERERLLETLEAWLAHQRHTPRIASELHVHPQTVRYRMAKLRELLGDTLETADGRFELELALRSRNPPRG